MDDFLLNYSIVKGSWLWRHRSRRHHS